MSASEIFADEVYSKNKRGNDEYKKQKYDEALKNYDDALLIAPSDSLLKMNRGAALYRLGRFREADSAYAGTLSLEDKRKLADAHYNLGNIQFKEGDLLMQGGGQGADEKYKSALQNYIAALDLRPNDRDAKWNIELTQRRIRQQEQQQKDRKDQDKDKKDKDNKQDQKQQQDKDKKEQDKQDKKQDQDKKDQDKKDQDKKDQEKKDEQDRQNQDKQQQQQEQPKPQPQDNKENMKKKEAERIIMQFADDADSLNKPPKKKGFGLMQRKPEKDW